MQIRIEVVRAITGLLATCLVSFVFAGTANAQLGKWLKDKAGDVAKDAALSQLKGPKDADGCATTASVASVFAGSLTRELTGGQGAGAMLTQYGGTMLTGAMVKELTCGERAEMGEAVTETLETKQDGEQHSYQSSDTGKTVTVTPTETKEEQKQVELEFRRPVWPHSAKNIVVDGGYYEITGRTLLRHEPKAWTRLPLKVLKEGNIVHIYGRVDGAGNKPWGMVEIDGAISGYVDVAFLADTATDPAVGEKKAISRLTDSDAKRAIREQQKMRKKKTGGSAAAKDETVEPTKEEIAETRAILKKNETTQEEATVTTECRTVEVSVESTEETNTLCKSPDGIWVL